MNHYLNKDNANLLVGLKIKKIRQQKKLSLVELSDKTGMSVSYLSEIEQGKKSPRLDKILAISGALGLPQNELLTLDIGGADFNAFHSSMLDSFPFQNFGITAKDVLELINNTDENLSAFIRTLHDVVQMYDTEVDYFLITALRALQLMHKNYFESLERKADEFRKDFRSYFAKDKSRMEVLTHILTETFGYRIEDINIDLQKDLSIFRSVYVNRDGKKLYVNKQLSGAQKQFALAKELGYCYLGLAHRPETSPALELNSFDLALNDFRSGYFAGTLLMNEDQLKKDLAKLLSKRKWNPDYFWSLIEKYDVSPETFFHRLTQLLPTHFGVEKLYYLRLHNLPQTERFDMTKELNFTEDFSPKHLQSEHYCRRWTAIRLLKQLQATPGTEYLLTAEHVQKVGSSHTYFNISYGHRSRIRKDYYVSFTIGFLLDEKTRSAIQFWNDPGLKTTIVNETCERCPLSAEECHERVAPPAILEKLRKKEQTKQKISDLINQL